MFDLILIAALGSFGAPTKQPAVCREAAPVLVAQFHPCVYPNKCAVETPAVAQVRPCVWPNQCSVETPAVAQFSPCVYPNKCAVETPTVAQFRPCMWPNKCGAAKGEFSI